VKLGRDFFEALPEQPGDGNESWMLPGGLASVCDVEKRVLPESQSSDTRDMKKTNHGWTRINTDENVALSIPIVVWLYYDPSKHLKKSCPPDLIRVHPWFSPSFGWFLSLL
jgi:hypothetical protein